MKMEELRKLNNEQLQEKLGEQRQELFNLRFRHATAQLENTAGIPAAKRSIAKILTILNEREEQAAKAKDAEEKES